MLIYRLNNSYLHFIALILFELKNIKEYLVNSCIKFL